MRLRRTIAYSISVLVLILVVLGALLFFSADRILNSARVRTMVHSALLEAVSGTARYDKLDMSFFPLPHLTVRGLQMTYPGGSAAVEEVVLNPRFLPLLAGEFQLDSILLINPRLEITLPKEDEEPFDPAQIEEKLIPVFHTVRSYVPGLNLDVRSGALKLYRPDAKKEGTWVFQNIDLKTSLSRGLELNLQCGSSPWGPLSLKGRVRYQEGTLDADQLKAGAGRNSISDASAALTWKEQVRVKAKVGSSVFILEDIESWTGGLTVRLAPFLKKIGGTVLLASADFEGPLDAAPKARKEWRYAAEGSLEEIVIETDNWSAPVRIPNAAYRLDQDSASLHEAEILTADSALKLSGLVRTREQTVENLHLSGKIGRKTVQEMTDRTETLRGSIPPLDINVNGNLSYRPGTVGLQKVNLSAGGSSVSNLTGRLDLAGQDYLRAEADRVVIVPGELGDPALRVMRRALPELKSISGVFTFTTVRLEGAPGKTGDWRYSALGTIRDAAVEAGFLPGSLRIPAASFSANNAQFTFQDTRVSILDSDISGSGRLRIDKSQKGTAEINFEGRIGESSVKWAAGRFEFPAEVLLAQAFTVKGGRMNWSARDRFSLEGDINLQPSGDRKALRLSFELDRTPEAIEIRKAALKDDLTDAVFSLNYGKDRVAAFSFSGSLHKRTLDSLYRIEQPEGAWISGKLSGRIPLADPRTTTASGMLKAAHLQVPMEGRGPLSMKALDFTADRNRFLIQSSDLVWQGHPFSVQGTARMPSASRPERIIHIDADVRAEKIDVDALTKIFETKKAEPETKQAEKPAPRPFGWVSGLPVQGTVRIKADRLVRNKLALEPLAAEVSLGPERVRIFVTKALLCGIPIPGTVEIKPGGFLFTFRSEVRNYAVAPVLKCLTGERMGLTGFVTFRAELEGTDRISESLWGDGVLTIRDGRIYRFSLMTRILEFLNITQIVLGELPDFSRKGMGYDVIRIRYRLEGTKLIMSRIALRGDTLAIAGEGTIDLARNTMNLTLLVSPLRTIDKILSKIPIVRNFRGILGIPVSVYGKLDSPVIVPLSPGAVGAHIFDLMKEAIELPFNLF